LQAAPAGVVDYVCSVLGSARIRELPAADGFTSAVASIVMRQSGQALFVKAAPSADDAGIAVRTGAILADTISDLGPALVSWTEIDGWSVALYERLTGAAVDVWRADDLQNLAHLASSMRERLDPCSIAQTQTYADSFAPLLGTWSALTADNGDTSQTVDHVRDRPLPYGLHVETLAALEADWFDTLRPGTALQHGDIRRDNVIREPSGRLRLVDWTHRWTGPNWADWVRLVPDLAADGLDPERAFQAITMPDSRSHDHAVNVMLAGLAGRCWRDGHRAPVPGLPQLRPMQLTQGDMTLRWLAHRLR
jgi:hypothetical protein